MSHFILKRLFLKSQPQTDKTSNYRLSNSLVHGDKDQNLGQVGGLGRERGGSEARNADFKANLGPKIGQRAISAKIEVSNSDNFALGKVAVEAGLDRGGRIAANIAHGVNSSTELNVIQIAVHEQSDKKAHITANAPIFEVKSCPTNGKVTFVFEIEFSK